MKEIVIRPKEFVDYKNKESIRTHLLCNQDFEVHRSIDGFFLGNLINLDKIKVNGFDKIIVKYGNFKKTATFSIGKILV